MAKHNFSITEFLEKDKHYQYNFISDIIIVNCRFYIKNLLTLCSLTQFPSPIIYYESMSGCQYGILVFETLPYTTKHQHHNLLLFP